MLRSTSSTRARLLQRSATPTRTKPKPKRKSKRKAEPQPKPLKQLTKSPPKSRKTPSPLRGRSRSGSRSLLLSLLAGKSPPSSPARRAPLSSSPLSGSSLPPPVPREVVLSSPSNSSPLVVPKRVELRTPKALKHPGDTHESPDVPSQAAQAAQAAAGASSCKRSREETAGDSSGDSEVELVSEVVPQLPRPEQSEPKRRKVEDEPSEPPAVDSKHQPPQQLLPQLLERCSICNSTDSALLEACASCGLRVHLDCYYSEEDAMQEKPFRCAPCADGVHSSQVQCVLCPYRGGALSPIHPDTSDKYKSPTGRQGKHKHRYAHTSCASYLREPYFKDGFVVNLDAVQAWVKKLRCMICGQRDRFPLVLCGPNVHRFPFHFFCMRQARAQFGVFLESTQEVLCPKHAAGCPLGPRRKRKQKPVPLDADDQCCVARGAHYALRHPLTVFQLTPPAGSVAPKRNLKRKAPGVPAQDDDGDTDMAPQPQKRQLRKRQKRQDREERKKQREERKRAKAKEREERRLAKAEAKRKAAEKKRQAEQAALDDDVYEVERLLDVCLFNPGTKPTRYYLVKWLGYSPEENTWEPGPNMPTAMVAEFHRRYPKRRPRLRTSTFLLDKDKRASNSDDEESSSEEESSEESESESSSSEEEEEEEEAPAPPPRIECGLCHEMFTRRGISRHVASCALKMQAKHTFDDDDDDDDVNLSDVEVSDDDASPASAAGFRSELDLTRSISAMGPLSPPAVRARAIFSSPKRKQYGAKRVEEDGDKSLNVLQLRRSASERRLMPSRLTEQHPEQKPTPSMQSDYLMTIVGKVGEHVPAPQVGFVLSCLGTLVARGHAPPRRLISRLIDRLLSDTTPVFLAAQISSALMRAQAQLPDVWLPYDYQWDSLAYLVDMFATDSTDEQLFKRAAALRFMNTVFLQDQQLCREGDSSASLLKRLSSTAGAQSASLQGLASTVSSVLSHLRTSSVNSPARTLEATTVLEQFLLTLSNA